MKTRATGAISCSTLILQRKAGLRTGSDGPGPQGKAGLQSLHGFWGMGWSGGRESRELLEEAFPEERKAEGAGEVS